MSTLCALQLQRCLMSDSPALHSPGAACSDKYLGQSICMAALLEQEQSCSQS